MGSPPPVVGDNGLPDRVELALATALERASEAGAWAAVEVLAGELGARRAIRQTPTGD